MLRKNNQNQEERLQAEPESTISRLTQSWDYFNIW